MAGSGRYRIVATGSRLQYKVFDPEGKELHAITSIEWRCDESTGFVGVATLEFYDVELEADGVYMTTPDQKRTITIRGEDAKTSPDMD